MSNITNAYVVPYRVDRGQKFVLVGHKAVISLEAVAQNNTRRCSMVNNGAIWRGINFGDPLTSDGRMKPGSQIGKRFDGMVMPAGGMAMFFGGRVNKSEDPKRGALRELNEELGLNMNIDKLYPQLETIVEFRSWGGAYYGLNVDTAEGVDWLRLPDELARKVGPYRNLDLVDVLNGRVRKTWYPECLELKWMPCNQQTARYVGEDFDQQAAGESLNRFGDLIKSVTGASFNSSQFVNAIANYLNHSDVEGNVAAVQRLI